MKTVKKVWGQETWVVNNEGYCMKFLDIDVGGCSSLHYHKRKHETFYVDRGICFIELREIGESTLRCKTISYGDILTLPPFTVHRFWIPRSSISTKTGRCRLIEVSTHHDDDDVFRLEESKRL